MNATRVLEGRREGGLLAFSSVRRMTDILSKRCREQSWVRTSVATLDRFRTMSGYADLETLREQALADPVVAEGALASFAAALVSYTESQVSALAMGTKIWFRLNGIAVPWRPLGGISSSSILAAIDQQGIERVVPFTEICIQNVGLPAAGAFVSVPVCAAAVLVCPVNARG